VLILATLLVLWLGFGGGGNDYLPKDFNKRVKAEVSDKQVRKEVDAVVKQINKDVEAYRNDVEALAREGISLNADYDAELEKFETLVDRIVGSREEIQKKLLDDRYKLVTILSEEQWKAIFADER
jgi:predicted metal-dependent hydrolase